MNWYLEVLRKYADFGGRARRKEYWMFLLFNVLISLALAVVEVMFGLVTEFGLGMISMVYTLLLVIPSLAVAVRRLHDTGRSAWWLLIAFVPLVGAIALFVFSVQEGESGHNEYGPNPKSALA